MAIYELGVFKGNKLLGKISLDKYLGRENTKKLFKVDSFTFSFENEEKLKNEFSNEIMHFTDNYADVNLKVVYKYGEIKDLPVVYKEDYIYYYFENQHCKIEELSQDKEMFKILYRDMVNHYSNNVAIHNRRLIAELSLLQSLNTQIINEDDVSDYAYDAGRFRLKEFHGMLIDDYKLLRDFTFFIKKFEEKIKRKERIKELKEDKEIITIAKELSILDLVPEEKFTVDNDEPVFPPNSEEEKIYNMYLDDLQTMNPEDEDPYKKYY